MVNHKKVYCTFFNLDISDHILCTNCQQVAVDIHHIHPRGMGGPEKDCVGNVTIRQRVVAHLTKVSELNT